MDLPPFESPKAYIDTTSRLGVPFTWYDPFDRPEADPIFRVGDSGTTDHVFVLDADARSVREISIAGNKHGLGFVQLSDGSRKYILAVDWPSLPLGRISRELQNVKDVKLDLDQSEIQVAFAAGQLLVHDGDGKAYEGAASELIHLNVQSIKPQAVVTLDVGMISEGSVFPFDGISVSLADQSMLKLVGTSNLPISYEFESDRFIIQIGPLKLRVLDPSNLTVDDQLNILNRTWQFTIRQRRHRDSSERPESYRVFCS